MSLEVQRLLAWVQVSAGQYDESIPIGRRLVAAEPDHVHTQQVLGDHDRSFVALERMAAEKDPRVGLYLTFPELASLRADPRMPAFRRKLGLSN